MKAVVVLTLLVVFKVVTSSPLFKWQPVVTLEPLTKETQVHRPPILQERSKMEDELTLCRQELAEMKIKSIMFRSNATNSLFSDLDGRFMELVEAKMNVQKQLDLIAQQISERKSNSQDGDVHAFNSIRPTGDSVGENFENSDDGVKKGSESEPNGSTTIAEADSSSTVVPDGSTTVAEPDSSTVAEPEPGCSKKPKGKHIFTYLFVYSIIHITMN